MISEISSIEGLSIDIKRVTKIIISQDQKIKEQENNAETLKRNNKVLQTQIDCLKDDWLKEVDTQKFKLQMEEDFIEKASSIKLNNYSRLHLRNSREKIMKGDIKKLAENHTSVN